MNSISKKALLPVLALGMVATSCQEEDYGFSQQDVKMSVYQKTFDEVFAGIDKSVFMGIKDAELDLKVNIPGDFTLYLTEQRICEQNPANVLFERFDGIEGDGAGYAYKFSLPSHIDSVWVSLATADNGIWARKVAIQNGVCAATFGEMAQTRAGDDGSDGYTGFHSHIMTIHNFYWHEDNDPNSPIEDVTSYYTVYSGCFSQLLTAEYLLAWEDLGSTFDFDFNDVVFSISRDYSNLGQDDAPYGIKVKVLAAGGTMPIAIGVSDLDKTKPEVATKTILEFNGKQDIHAAWGVDTNVRVNTTLRETEENYSSLKDLFVTGKEPLETTFYSKIPAQAADVYHTVTLSKYASRFYLVRNKDYYGDTGNTEWDWDHTLQTSMWVPNQFASYITTLDGVRSSYSQCIIIADRNWQWPAEHEGLLDAYPDIKEWRKDNYAKGSIWSGNGTATYTPYEGSFADILTANYNSIRWSQWPHTNSKGDFVMSSEYTDSTYIKYVKFEELDLDSKCYQDFTADTASSSTPWVYDIPFKSKRLLLPYSKVKDHRYRYVGEAPIQYTKKTEDDTEYTYTSYSPGDEFFIIAIVMYDRPYNESTELYLQTCAENSDFYGKTYIGDDLMAWFDAYNEPTKSAIDLVFSEIFLQNFYDVDSIDHADFDQAHTNNDSFRNFLPDYTRYATGDFAGEEKVFPIDMIIKKKLKLDDEAGTLVCTTKAPQTKYYKVFVGTPVKQGNSGYVPDEVDDNTPHNTPTNN